VLSTPFEIRLLLARDVRAFNQLIRVFAEEVVRHQRSLARDLGITRPLSAGVSFPQRFGSALQMNPHIHSIFCDGVFELPDEGGPALFHPLPAPTAEQLFTICQRVHDRLRRWLVKRGLLATRPTSTTTAHRSSTPSTVAHRPLCRSASSVASRI
jgi:hypothetical protein